MKIGKKLIALTTLAVFAAILSTIYYPPSTAEATLAGFDPGNIMSDYVMSNKNTMTEAQIQAFLSSKGNCNDRGHGLITSGTASSGYKYTYHIKDGHYVCMADEVFGNDGFPATTGQTAAHIIWQAAQDYSINPQVLIVLLQKEQALVSDSWPSTLEYRSATGYGCPDTAACSTEYYGFINQIRNAAAFFHNHLVNNRNWNWGYDVGWNDIKWHPNSGCGTSSVNIQNKATAALYIYTPYRPNQAALNAGYAASGDSCSSYGNRNFYNYFTDWFGSTQTTITATYLESLETGNYSIKIAANTYKTVFSDEKNAYVSGDNRILKIIKNTDSTYTIADPTTNKVFGVDNAIAIEGALIRLHDSNGIDAQKWKIRINADGTYSIVSALSNYMVLDISDGRISDSQKIQLYTSNGTAAQKFYIVGLPEFTDQPYMIKSDISNDMAIDINGGSSANGANVQIHSKNDTKAQQFSVLFDEKTGYYTIKNIGSNKVLDVTSGSMASGTNVQQYESNGTCAQEWRITKVGQLYSINAACSDHALDVSDGKAINGKNIQIWSKNDSGAQRWLFDEIAPTTHQPDTNNPSSLGDITYSAHVSGFGWMDPVQNGALSGTTGQSRQMEAIKINLSQSLRSEKYLGSHIMYKTHSQSLGWLAQVGDNEIGGTTGQSKRLEAIQISLSGPISNDYTVQYRAHVSKIGWQVWTSEGTMAGTTGQSLSIEALEIKLVKK